jgi:Protein of unknown function (DUF3073)
VICPSVSAGAPRWPASSRTSSETASGYCADTIGNVPCSNRDINAHCRAISRALPRQRWRYRRRHGRNVLHGEAREWIDVGISAPNRVRLYLYGKLAAPSSPRGICGGSLCVMPWRVRPGAWQTSVSSRGIVGPDGLRTFEGVEPMGRGRAKAKQVKVARQLKYNSGGTDLDRLRAELAAERGGDNDSGHAAYDEYDDDAADDEVDDEDEDDEDSWSGRSGRQGGR